MNERTTAIAETLSQIRSQFSGGVDVPRMERAKTALMALCERGDLFNFDTFPLPADGGVEQTYLIHQDDDGAFALYVNCGRPGQAYRPHNHGGAWAIVAAVQGEETHRLFQETGVAGQPIEHKATITVRPGEAVSILPDGVHAIAAEGDAPLLHLHLYGKSFDHQSTRREFDEETGEVFEYDKAEIGEIVDARR